MLAGMLQTEVVATLPVSAASGLARVGRRLYVVADDEHHLGVFDMAGQGGPARVPLFAGELPEEAKARKDAKPDLEALVALPVCPGFADGGLLALGSGSRPQRQRAALLDFGPLGELMQPARQIDLAPLYAPLHARHAQLNIEGGFVSAGRFCLLQRGNAAHPDNVLIAYDWAATQAWLNGGPPPLALSSTAYALGDIDGVPLCFTDGAALPDGGWVFCAAAEATEDNYADGPCRGSAVGLVAADGRLRGVWPLSLRCKAEGVVAHVENGGLQLLLVTDADDRGEPALLLSASRALPD